MSSRVPIPEGLGEIFRVDVARAAGLTPGRLRGVDLARPFWGVRSSADAAANTVDHARAYAIRMPLHAFFSHATAAQLHRIPLPRRLDSSLPLHVAVPADHTPVEGRGTRGHRLSVDPADVIHRRHLRITSLERTVLDLAAILDDEELLAAGDNALWHRRRNGDRASSRSLTLALDRFQGRRGRARLIALMPLMTNRADSPPESAMRLRFTRASLPPMLINESIYAESGEFIAMPDLQFAPFRMALDYEGDHHRIDAAQWRKDLARVPRLQDEGWHHTRISGADLADSTELIARLRRVLIERGWSSEIRQ